MADISPFASFIESNIFYQIELFSLLAGLVLSLLLSNTFPYFLVSAICLLATDAALAFQSFQGLAGRFAYVDATITLTLLGLLAATFVYALVKGFRLSEVRLHAATTFGLSVFLAVKAFRILQDNVRPIDHEVDCCTLRAFSFAMMHLLASLLMVYECSFVKRAAVPQTPEGNPDEKTSLLV